MRSFEFVTADSVSTFSTVATKTSSPFSVTRSPHPVLQIQHTMALTLLSTVMIMSQMIGAPKLLIYSIKFRAFIVVSIKYRLYSIRYRNDMDTHIFVPVSIYTTRTFVYTYRCVYLSRYKEYLDMLWNHQYETEKRFKYYFLHFSQHC